MKRTGVAKKRCLLPKLQYLQEKNIDYELF